MTHSLTTVLAFKSYQNQAEVLVRKYVLADPYIPYTSILGGILTCKLVYDLTELISTFYFRSYNGLMKIQKIEWNNRGMSTLHVIFISFMSLYFVFWSELFSDQNSTAPVTLRNSPISTFALGMSVGYFISDLGMICWLYPSLGGIEYIVHHSLSGIAVAYSMFMGEGQLYTFMALISELTTPEIKLRWYLDMAGLKRSSAYLINGVVIYFTWLVARILLFVYMFYHVYLHHAQVLQMHTVGFLLVFAVPLVLAVMNTRGNTVLHVAARRKEPSIIVQLLNKGAIASEPTFEGQCAVTICRRLTRPKDYQVKREKGQEANKDQICMEVLERETCRNPTAGDASIPSLAVADDLHMKLLYLEDRVAFARMFFPTEAKLAMEIAHAETTSELAGLLSSRGSSGNLVEVDLNETPITQNKRLLSRIETLSRTVELGRQYFPHCSQVRDKFLEDGLPDAFYLEKGTPEEQRMKRMRFMELKDEVQKAFNEDKTSGCSETGSNIEIISLSKLSSSLGQLLCDSGSDFSDAEIVVEDSSVRIHRCILAARSKFFNDLFRKDKGFVGKEGKPQYYMTSLLPYGKIGYEAFVIFLNYLYTGKLRSSPLEVSTCVDNMCRHDACRPAIDFAVELMYASTIFQVTELVSLFQRRLLNLGGKAIVEDVIPILLVAFHCQLNELLTQCVQRVARSDLETISIEKELPYKVAKDIRLLRFSFQTEQDSNAAPADPLREKQVKRIHKALDSDDIELVRLLLVESDITLDEAYALHYAVAYCDPKIVTEVLSLGLADVNLQNTRGNSVLHVAARRKEPSIIASLLNKGACASEPTFEGQCAVTICRRLTRLKDYHMKREKDQICIEVLEREMRRNPIAGDASIASLAMADDLHMKLLYLENRVSFVRMFFPTEAKLAMEIAHAETTSELAGLLSSRGSSGNLVEVDLNETPITQNKRLLSRIETLSRTVELGRRYFPHCSQVLDKFLEDDLPGAFYLEKGTPEEQRMKRMRFMELKGEVQKAFNKDKAELHGSGISSSSSSSFMDRVSYLVQKV